MAGIVLRCEVGTDEGGRVYLAFRGEGEAFTVTLSTRTARAIWSALGATLRHDAHPSESYEVAATVGRVEPGNVG